MLHRLLSKALNAKHMLAYKGLLAKARQLAVHGPEGKGIGFFIVSSGRSGSTLLRRMLHAHPAVSIPPESENLLIRCMDAYAGTHTDATRTIEEQLRVVRSQECMRAWHLEEEHLVSEWRASLAAGEGFASFHGSIYRSYAASHKPGATMHGDKTPLLVWYLDLLHILYPSARIIFLVRHPLDTISSIAGMEVHGHDLKAATDRWLGAAELLLGAGGRDYAEQVLPLHYEDLVTDPESALHRVCNALGVDFSEHLIHERGHDLGDTGLVHHQAVKRPVNRDAIGGWKERLTQAQAEAIMQRCGHSAERLGYTF